MLSDTHSLNRSTGLTPSMKKYSYSMKYESFAVMRRSCASYSHYLFTMSESKSHCTVTFYIFQKQSRAGNAVQSSVI